MKKKLFSILTSLLIVCTLSSHSVSAKPPRLVDGADLLTESEEAAISARLDEISTKHEYDVVIVTQEDIGNKSAQAFADDYYDENGYGYGDKYTGVLLLIAFDDEGGMWHISTCGSAINAFSDYNIDAIGSAMEYDLGDGDYADAFNTFIDECDYYIDGYINGFPFDFGMNLVISLVVGFIIALISVKVMKGKLKSVALQRDAATYVKNGSMNVTLAREIYLYRNVTRVAKPQNNGSSTHTSSSGRSHGGGGGRF